MFNPTTLTAGTIALVIAMFLLGNPVLDAIERNWLDLRFRIRGPLTPTPTVVLAVIDEKSLTNEGRWPWPRVRFAQLIDRLSTDGAKAVGFDITFAEPDENSSLELVNELTKRVDALPKPDPALVEFIRQSRTHADNDQALVSALRRSSMPVVLGYFFHMTEAGTGYHLDQDDINSRMARISTSKFPIVYYNSEAGDSPFIKAYAPQNNLDIFTTAATASGYFSVQSDPDGVVRWMPLMLQGGDDLFPPLSLLTVWHALGKPQLAVKTGSHGVEGVQLGDRFIPTDESGRMLINYRGPARTFQYYALSDIIDGHVAPGTFKDKIVMVGATAIGIGDLRSTPFAPVYPGSEIHANVIDNILTGDYLEKPRWAEIFDVLAVIVLATIVGGALPRMTALQGLALTVLLFVLFIAFAYLIFVRAHLWLNMVYPVFALAATYTMLTLYRYITEERERKRIKVTFQQYVSADVIEEALQNPEHLRIGGQEKLLTVLFSDLAGFTAFSEHNTPRQVINLLSEYHDRMTERLFEHQGTLIGYMGDELIALFGAPVEQQDQAQRACAAALAMLHQRNALGDEWVKMGRPRLRARTGINTGRMLVGNIGSKYRFTYSVLGDPVNLASRLEQINKIYGTEIIISEDTARLVASSFVLRRLDVVRVVGRKQALGIYELIATAGAELPPDQEKMLSLYDGALEAYRGRRFDEAIAMFTECRTIRPADGPSRLMVDRCRLYQQAPPPEGWDGTFEHATKA